MSYKEWADGEEVKKVEVSLAEGVWEAGDLTLKISLENTFFGWRVYVNDVYSAIVSIGIWTYQILKLERIDNCTIRLCFDMSTKLSNLMSTMQPDINL